MQARPRRHAAGSRVGDRPLSAKMLIECAWIHLDERKLIAPPADLLELMKTLPRAEGFEVLPSVIRREGAE